MTGTPTVDRRFVEVFRLTVTTAAERLLAVPDETAARPRAAGKWSPKEIIGHLIDSAANNHGRFVRAQATDDLVCEGYDQDAWVRVQQYNTRPWPDLVRLWRDYNLHLASVMASAEPNVLDRPRARHNLDRIAYAPVSRDQPVTLAYFMRDYVAHLEHHLQQIDRAIQ
jgi:DinB family protein